MVLFAMMVDNNSSHDNLMVTDDSDNSIDPPSLIYEDNSSSNKDSSDRDSIPSLVNHGCYLDNNESNSELSNNSVLDLIPQAINSDDDTVPEVIPSRIFTRCLMMTVTTATCWQSQI